MAKISWYPSRRLGRPSLVSEVLDPPLHFPFLGPFILLRIFFKAIRNTGHSLFSDNSACSNHRCWCWRCRFVCWLHAPDKTGLQVLKYFIHSLCREKATKRSENYTFLTVTITELMSMQRRVGEPANARTHDIKFFNKSEQSCIATVAILFVWVRKGSLLLFTT